MELDSSDWIAIVAAAIAFAALTISIITSVKTHELANKDFILTHRPFVWVENFGYVENDVLVSPINVVMILIQNSPAKFHREYYHYYVTNPTGKVETVYEEELFDHIRYPDKTQYTSTAGSVTKDLVRKLVPFQELERVIRIDYSWLSADTKYYFDSKWRFNKMTSVWEVVSHAAN